MSVEGFHTQDAPDIIGHFTSHSELPPSPQSTDQGTSLLQQVKKTFWFVSGETRHHALIGSTSFDCGTGSR